jgi:hypothetical protein
LYGIAREVIAAPTVQQGIILHLSIIFSYRLPSSLTELKTLAIDTPSAITLIQPPNPALNKFTMPDFSVPPPTVKSNKNFY